MTSVHIEIFQGHEPALNEADVTVVIDVIRAFTTTHVAFERGASEVLLAGPIGRAFALKDAHPDYVLAGERDAIKIEGFDIGNSPFECAARDFDGRGMILTTTNGVRATLHALRAPSGEQREVLVTGFTNAVATADYVRKLADAGEVHRVNLLASHPTGDDDLACAEFIRDRILGRQDGVGEDEVIARIRGCESAEKFLDPDREKYDRRDVEVCMTPRRSSFVMRARAPSGQPVLTTKETAES